MLATTLTRNTGNFCSHSVLRTRFVQTHPLSNRFFSSSSRRAFATSPFTTHTGQTSRKSAQNQRFLTKLVGASALAGAGVGFASFQIHNGSVQCDGPGSTKSTPLSKEADLDPLPPPPRSSINAYQLTFGTVAGFCAGVFIKKGVKMVAFVLGGVFVVLQYFVSLNLTRVNWSSAETRFQKLFYSKEVDATGKEVRRAPTVYSLWRWIVDFLTADFPPRATFIAGLILGIRVG